jgi:hypothetical protein
MAVLWYGARLSAAATTMGDGDAPGAMVGRAPVAGASPTRSSVEGPGAGTNVTAFPGPGAGEPRPGADAAKRGSLTDGIPAELARRITRAGTDIAPLLPTPRNSGATLTVGLVNERMLGVRVNGRAAAPSGMAAMLARFATRFCADPSLLSLRAPRFGTARSSRGLVDGDLAWAGCWMSDLACSNAMCSRFALISARISSTACASAARCALVWSRRRSTAEAPSRALWTSCVSTEIMFSLAAISWWIAIMHSCMLLSSIFFRITCKRATCA